VIPASDILMNGQTGALNYTISVKKRPALQLFMTLWCLAACVSGASAMPVSVGKGTDILPLAPYIQLLEDKNSAYTINDMLDGSVTRQFQPVDEKMPNYGFMDSSFWIRFSIIPDYNTADESFEYYIELPHPLYDIVEVYLFDSQGGFNLMRSGDTLPFNTRRIKYHNYLFPVKLKHGVNNTVFMHITTTGSFQLPLNLVRSDYLLEREQLFLISGGMLYGILIIILLASILFFFIEMDRLYLYYAAFVLSIVLWLLTLDGFAFQYLWPGSPWWANRSVPFLINGVIISTLLFCRNFFVVKETSPRVDKLVLGLVAVSLFLALVLFFIPYTMSVQIITFYSIITSSVLILTGLYYVLKKQRLARYFTGALFLFLLGTILVALNRYGLVQKNFLSENAQKIGALIQVIVLYLALGERISIINREKADARNDAATVMKKYTIIAEESDDIIFTLDSSWNFISSNKAIKKHLKISERELPRVNLLDLIYEENPENREETLQFVKKKLEDFRGDTRPVSFKAVFKSSFMGEPVTMNVNLEHISIEGKHEILGRATSVMEDTLLRYFVEEKQKYVIENYLLTADETTQRMTRNLERYITSREANMIRMALREIMINAIEHGNLGITFDEKSGAINTGAYFSLIEARRQIPEYRDRRVSVKCVITSRGVEYTVRDDGQGFDYHALLDKVKGMGDKKNLYHGRGILMSMNIFDTVEYSDRGRRVKLVKYFSRGVKQADEQAESEHVLL